MFSYEKEKLKQEVKALEQEVVFSSTGYKYDSCKLNDQYLKEKSSYKKYRNKSLKIKGIRNLKILGSVSMLLLPFVVCGGVFMSSTFGINKAIKSFSYDVNDEIKFVSANNIGQKEEEDVTWCDRDTIGIKTKWFREGDTLVRYTYELEEDIDIHTEEEVMDIVNEDYFTLLNEYQFAEIDKEVVEFTEERSQEDLGEDIVEVNAMVMADEEYIQEENSYFKDQNHYLGSALISLIPTAVSVSGFCIFGYNLSGFAESIGDAFYDADVDLGALPNIKEKRKKLKALKKGIKK